MPTRSPALDRTLLALAHPTRRALVQRLMRGDARVTDLARPFDMSLEGVSKHLRVLERARLVRRTRSGREHVLALDVAPIDEAAAWLAEQRDAWNVRLDRLDALLRAEDEPQNPRPGPKPRSKPRPKG